MQSSSPSTGPQTALLPPTDLGNGFSSYNVSGNDFVVRNHYGLMKVVGIGSYGIVCLADNQKNGARIAIKRCRNIFYNLEDCHRILREVKLLRFMRHENVLSLFDFYLGGPKDTFIDVYIVTEFFDADLSTLLHSKANLTEAHIRFLFYQVIRGLKYIHSSNTVHRDLKPANLLIKLNCDLRICDFGLARSVPDGIDDSTLDMTEYVITRWYRPPELLMMNRRYGTSVDMWSAGCIFAELFTRKPLFSGNDYIKQLGLICQGVGPPSDEVIETFENAEAKNFVRQQNPVEAPDITKFVPQLTDADGQDLLRRLLQFDPKQRLSAAQTLDHSYFKSLHDPTDEPTAEAPFSWSLLGLKTSELLREEFRNEANLSDGTP